MCNVLYITAIQFSIPINMFSAVALMSVEKDFTFFFIFYLFFYLFFRGWGKMFRESWPCRIEYIFYCVGKKRRHVFVIQYGLGLSSCCRRWLSKLFLYYDRLGHHINTDTEQEVGICEFCWRFIFLTYCIANDVCFSNFWKIKTWKVANVLAMYYGSFKKFYL